MTSSIRMLLGNHITSLRVSRTSWNDLPERHVESWISPLVCDRRRVVQSMESEFIQRSSYSPRTEDLWRISTHFGQHIVDKNVASLIPGHHCVSTRYRDLQPATRSNIRSR